ncbi:MAG: hypothetical protein L0Y72_06350 [Gemmataceae bacterium]|nr:hypothetical protein [Gemmataceae bacterium]MCI0738646.1 hypothetical protein [Gemmataceae bacterium]
MKSIRSLLRSRWRLFAVIGFLLLGASAFYVAVYVEFGPVTRANFNRIQKGMTVKEVVAILGEPVRQNVWDKFIGPEEWFFERSWGKPFSLVAATEEAGAEKVAPTAYQWVLHPETHVSSWRGKGFWIDVFFDADAVCGAILSYQTETSSILDRLRIWLRF